MLTCQRANSNAAAFYTACKYTMDAISPLNVDPTVSTRSTVSSLPSLYPLHPLLPRACHALIKIMRTGLTNDSS